MQKKITRKQFILSILSVGAFFATSNVSSLVKTIAVTKKSANSYGNYSYGGSKKNA